MTEREADLTFFIRRYRALVATVRGDDSYRRPAVRPDGGCVMMPGKKHRLEKNAKDAEKRSRPTGEPPRRPEPSTRWAVDFYVSSTHDLVRPSRKRYNITLRHPGKSIPIVETGIGA